MLCVLTCKLTQLPTLPAPAILPCPPRADHVEHRCDGVDGVVCSDDSTHRLHGPLWCVAIDSHACADMLGGGLL